MDDMTWGLSVKCSKENQCFAASVGMAAKCLIYWGKINLLIGNVCCWPGAQVVRLTDLHPLVPPGPSTWAWRRGKRMRIMRTMNID